jgi:hypothetical protein
MEAICSSEMSVLTRATWRSISEDSVLLPSIKSTVSVIGWVGSSAIHASGLGQHASTNSLSVSFNEQCCFVSKFLALKELHWVKNVWA